MIQVISVNDPPTVVNAVSDIIVDEDSESLTISLSGAEGAPYFYGPVYTSDAVVAHVSASPGDGLITESIDAHRV